MHSDILVLLYTVAIKMRIYQKLHFSYNRAQTSNGRFIDEYKRITAEKQTFNQNYSTLLLLNCSPTALPGVCRVIRCSIEGHTSAKK